MYGPTYDADFGEPPLSVTIQGSEISNNTSGGGLTLDGILPDVEIIETTISGNHNTESGGGINSSGYYSFAVLSIRNSTISGNTSEANGGGIHGVSNLTLQESTVSGNTAQGDGGGIWLNSYSDAVIVRNTIAGNTAGGTGGGVFVDSSYSPYYGFGDATVHITGSIIANNVATTEPDVVLPVTSATINYSLIENPGSTTISGTGNIVGLDPMLGPLQDNGGGPTFTHAPA